MFRGEKEADTIDTDFIKVYPLQGMFGGNGGIKYTEWCKIVGFFFLQVSLTVNERLVTKVLCCKHCSILTFFLLTGALSTF